VAVSPSVKKSSSKSGSALHQGLAFLFGNFMLVEEMEYITGSLVNGGLRDVGGS
jgi:hypothetical protein